MKENLGKRLRHTFFLMAILLGIVVTGTRSEATIHQPNNKDPNNLYVIKNTSERLQVYTGSPDSGKKDGSGYAPTGLPAEDWSFCLQEGKSTPNYNPNSPPHFSQLMIPGANADEMVRYFNSHGQYLGLFNRIDNVSPDKLYSSISDKFKGAHTPRADEYTNYNQIRNLLYIYATDPKGYRNSSEKDKIFWNVIQRKVWEYCNSRGTFKSTHAIVNEVINGVDSIVYKSGKVNDYNDNNINEDRMIPRYIKAWLNVYDSAFVSGKGVQNTVSLDMEYQRERVEFNKTNINGINLAGAKFKITKEKKEEVDIYKLHGNDPEPVGSSREFTSNDRVHSEEMREGTYLVQEIETPRGFVKIPDFRIKVTVGGGVELVNPSSEVLKYVSTKGNRVNIKNKSNEVGVREVSFTKYTSNYKFANGAEIEVYDTTNNQKIAQWTTNSPTTNTSNTIKLSLKTGKKYKFVEKKAPFAHKTVEFFFTVPKNPNEDIILHNVDNTKIYNISGHQNINVAVVDDQQTKKKVKIRKLSEENKLLAGAQFKVYVEGRDDQTQTWDSQTSDKEIEVFANEEYVLEEVKAPGRLKKVDKFKFKVDDKGKVQIIGNKPAEVSVSGNAISIVNKRPSKYRIGFAKLISVSPLKYLSNARFELYNSTTNQKVEAWYTRPWITHFEVVPGSYTLKETEYPAGYRKIKQDIKFTVDIDGNVKVEDYDKRMSTGNNVEGLLLSPNAPSSTNQWEGEIPILYIFDHELDPKKVTISKIDYNGAHVGGAKFTIRDTEIHRQIDIGDQADDDTSEDTYLDKDIELTLRYERTYEIEEYETPVGYEKIKPFKLKVDEKGNLSLIDNNNGNNVRLEGNKLIMKDPFVSYNIGFKKVNHKNQVLPGATLELYSKNGNTWTWNYTWTSEQGDKIYGLWPGTYKIVEKSAPAGYDKAGELIFKLAMDGTITTLSNNSNISLTNKTFTIKDNPKDKDVTISKIDPKGRKLIGAKLTIYDTDDLTKAVGTITTGNQDQSIRLKHHKRYKLVETFVPEGFNKINDLEFEINGDGNVVVVGNRNDARADGGKLIVEDPLKPWNVKFKKLDEKKVALSGARFEVWKEDGSERVNAWNTTSGEISVPLTEGSYKIKEVTTPNGYQQLKEFIVDVSLKGKISLRNNDGNVEIVNDLVTMTNQLKEKDVVISKVDYWNRKLAGAKFELYDTEDPSKLYASFTSEKTDKQVKLKHKRTYLVKETQAPAGHDKVSDFKLSVGADGTLSLVDNNNGDKVRLDGNKLIVKDTYQTYDVQIKKVDKNGNPLVGVSLAIYSYNPTSGGWDWNHNWNSAKNPQTWGLWPGAYKITETKALDGYYTINEFIFDLSGDGSVKLRGSNENVKINGKTVEITNKPNERDLTIKKQNPASENLAGAVLEFYEADKLDTVYKSITTTDKEQTIKIKHEKTYLVKEKTAPETYDKITDFKFSVDKEGNISFVGDHPGVNLVDNKLVITDEPTKYKVKFTKVDDEGNTLTTARLFFYSVKDGKDTEINKWNTNIQPEFDILPGTYKIKETQIPNGHDGFDDFTFDVDKKGKIVLGEKAKKLGIYVKENTLELMIVNPKIREKDVVISKVDPSGQKVRGAKFTITDTTDTSRPVAEFTSDDKNDSQIRIRCQRTYIIKEIQAPTGYEPIADFKINIAKDGTISFEGNHNGVALSEGKLVITDPQKIYPIVFKKTDEEGNPLKTARLQIFAEDGTTEVLDAKTNNKAVWTTNNANGLTINLRPGKYIMKEVTTPAGYETLRQFKFSIGLDGSIRLIDSDENVTSNDTTITIKNTKTPPQEPKKSIDITVHKILLTNEELDDWTSPEDYDGSQDMDDFKALKNSNYIKQIPNVYFAWKNDKGQYINDHGQVVDSVDKAYGKFTNDEGATFDLSNIPDGTYYIHEIKEKSTYQGPLGALLTRSKANPVEVKLPLRNKDGVVEHVHVYPKNTEDRPKIDKNFADSIKEKDSKENIDTELNVDTYQREKSKISRMVGDKIPYQVKTLIPQESSYKILAWTDTMTQGLTYNKDLKIDGANLGEGDYTISQDDRGFSLELSDSGLTKVENASKNNNLELMITYSATLNADAIVDLEKIEENTIGLDYANSKQNKSTPKDGNPVGGKIRVQKVWDNNNTHLPLDDDNLALTYILEEKDGDKYKEIKSVTLRKKVGDNNQTFNYEFVGLDNSKTYRVRERVAGYNPEYTSFQNGVVAIKNTKDLTSLRPSNPKLVTYGKRFIKVDNTTNERLFGARFVIKKDNKFLKVKTVGQGKSDKDNLDKAKRVLDQSLDAYDKNDEASAKANVLKLNDAYLKAIEKEGLGYEWTDKENDPDIIKLISNDRGQFQIKGLSAGEYSLEETQAPVGYAKISKIKFDVQENSYNTGTASYDLDSVDKNSTAVPNRKVSIPQTDGKGNIIFIAMGIILMVYAGIGLGRKAKERQIEK